MRLRLTAAAEADIAEILLRSEEDFGFAARERYERLILIALRDIATAPFRPGSTHRPELGDEQGRSWHLKHSRERARGPNGIVRHPRHLILYRMEAPDQVAIIRLLHDAMEVSRHLPQNSDRFSR